MYNARDITMATCVFAYVCAFGVLVSILRATFSMENVCVCVCVCVCLYLSSWPIVFCLTRSRLWERDNQLFGHAADAAHQ